jgi:hypothetical protein
MEPEGSLPHLQAPDTCPYPEPARSSPYLPIPLLEDPFLGEFVKLQKVTVSCIMSVCLSIHLSTWNNMTPSGQIFMKFDI